MRPISRRSMLRGAGAAVALPFLESLAPARSEGKPPVRMFIYVVGGGAYPTGLNTTSPPDGRFLINETAGDRHLSSHCF